MAARPGAVFVLSGLSEFRRALAAADAQAADDFKSVLEDVAKPMALHATGLAMQRIPRMTLPWAENRVGVSAREVYIVPRKRGTSVPRRKRPNLAELLIDRAYDPTAEQFEPRIRADVERALDRIANTVEFQFARAA
jgi:hypothetical protein